MVRYVRFVAFLVFASSSAVAAERPERIVVAGGDLTEVVYALGAADRLVGVDSTSVYPAEATEKAQIGYVRRISAEGILSLKPDLVLGAYDMGPPAAIDQLRAAGVRVALAPEGNSIDGVPAKIRFVGENIGLTDKAGVLAETVEADLQQAIKLASQTRARKRVIFVLSLGDAGTLVGGDGSSAATIISLAGGTNAATGFDGYKPMSREAIMEAQPDVVLMMNGRAEGHGGAQAVLDRPEFKLTPAARNGRLITMDGMLLLGFGPRTPQAIAELSQALSR